MASIESKIEDAIPRVCEGCMLKCRSSSEANKTADKDAMLLEATRLGHVDCAKACLATGADANAEDAEEVTALILATEGGHDACVRMLLQAGAEVNRKNRRNETALLLAIVQGHHRILEELIIAGASVNNPPDSDNDVNRFTYLHYTPLVLAVFNDQILCANGLIIAGANVNKQDRRGCTAIMMAAACGKKRFLDVLIQAGADINIQDHEDRTALIWATTRVKYECADTLIKAGADVNKHNYEGKTALLFSVMCGQNIFSKLLIDAGADVNISDIHGDTPLYHALIHGNLNPDSTIKSVKLLLLAGSSVNIANKGGQYCCAVVDLLRHFGRCRASFVLDVERYLLAAEERLDKALPEEGSQTSLFLSHLCRETIRKHLLKLDRHGNLFVRVPKLGLPATVDSFLLFNVSLSDEV